MKTKDIQQLIDNPLQPNPTAQAMDVEEILNESNFYQQMPKTLSN